MRPSRTIFGLLVLAFTVDPRNTCARSDLAQAQTTPYNLNVAVDEVSLTLHASDVHGLAINDLKLNELRLLDDGKPPRRVLVFQPLLNLPIRAGILIDTSQSMQVTRPIDRAIAVKYAQQILRQQTDQAFVTAFGRVSRLSANWTSDPNTLTNAIDRVGVIGGVTALYDAIYSTCRYQFGKIDHAASGNFILLFSDGEDDASFLTLKDDVDMCQRSNTAIYTFRAEATPGLISSGLRTLYQLASETGGRVFHDDDSDAEVANDLHTIDADLCNQYRLVYSPAAIKHDGAFHRIELSGPERISRITVRSGYYAPVH